MKRLPEDVHWNGTIPLDLGDKEHFQLIISVPWCCSLDLIPPDRIPNSSIMEGLKLVEHIRVLVENLPEKCGA